MNFTKEQIAEMGRLAAAHAYEVWMVRSAVKSNNRWSEYHTENIRRRIAADRALLKEAGC